MVKTHIIMKQTHAKAPTEKSISSWWAVQGLVFTVYFITTICMHGKPPAWALTFGIILCLAAYLRLKGAQLRRIADMVLLAYAVSFAVIASLLAYIKADEPLLQALLIIVALANIVASIASLRRKTK